MIALICLNIVITLFKGQIWVCRLDFKQSLALITESGIKILLKKYLAFFKILQGLAVIESMTKLNIIMDAKLNIIMDAKLNIIMDAKWLKILFRAQL